MFEMEVRQAPESDADAAEFEFILDDLVNAIDANLPEDSRVSRSGKIYTIETTLSEEEFKVTIKPAFSFYFENIRFVSISRR